MFEFDLEVSSCSFFRLQASLFAMSSNSLPHALVTWFDGWGAKLTATVGLAMEQAWQQAGCFDEGRKCHVPTPLLVGADCSGIEAQIHVRFVGWGVEHSHRWSSEIAEGPRGSSFGQQCPGCFGPRSKGTSSSDLLGGGCSHSRSEACVLCLGERDGDFSSAA